MRRRSHSRGLDIFTLPVVTRGDKFTLRLGGQNLTGITNVLVSGEGVKVTFFNT